MPSLKIITLKNNSTVVIYVRVYTHRWMQLKEQIFLSILSHQELSLYCTNSELFQLCTDAHMKSKRQKHMHRHGPSVMPLPLHCEGLTMCESVKHNNTVTNQANFLYDLDAI